MLELSRNNSCVIAAIVRCLAMPLLLTALFCSSRAVMAQYNPGQGPHVIRLQHIQAEKFAAQLRDIAAGAGQRPEILVDRRLNQLKVNGSRESLRIAADLAKALDKPTFGPQQAVVRSYWVDPSRRRSILAELRRIYPAASGARISEDNRTGQLIVFGPPRLQGEIEKTIGGLSRAPAAPPRNPSRRQGGQFQVRTVGAETSQQTHSLRNVSWRDLEDEIRRIWNGKFETANQNNGEIVVLRSQTESEGVVEIKIDRRRNQAAVEGPSRHVLSWIQLIRAIDSPKKAANQSTALAPLDRADPAKIQRAVALLNEASQGAASSIGSQSSRRGGENFRNNNTIAMVLQKNGQPTVRQPIPPVIAAPNQPQNGADNADSGLIGDVQIEFIPELGVFIVRGNKRDVERVMAIIEDIKRQSLETKPEIEIYQLRFANSEAVAEMVTELYDQIFAPRQGPVSIKALAKPNALLLIGDRESMASAFDLIKKLDQPVSPETQLQVFQLRHMAATDAETMVTNFFAEREALGTRVKVASDFRTNALIIQASPRDLAEVKLLLLEIDVDSSEAMHQLRIFHLKNSIADEMAAVLQEAFGSQAAGGAGQQPAGQAVATARSIILQYISLDPQGNKILDSGILSDIRFTADANANAIVVRGSAKSMDLIEAVINALDQLPAAEALIKVFPLENGDAANLQLMLQQLFGQVSTTGQGGGFQNQNQLQTTAGDNSLIPLRFAIDLRTNSIVASGSQGDLLVVETILARLDQGDIETRKTIVYRLKNAPSDDVAAALTNLLQRQTQVQQFGVTQQILSPFEQIEREVIVVSEPVTNSLLVSATPRYFEQIKKVIEDLDIRPPMVMIQVLIAEVSISDTYELGVELGIQDSLLFDRGLSTIGFPFVGAPLGNDMTALSQGTREVFSGQAFSSFATGRSGNQGYGGLVLSGGNESINVLIRALQEDGLLNILSRPQIMTLDNQLAFVQVGADVPQITNSTINNQGNTTNTVGTVPTGLLLRVQPRISPDGLVVMNLDVEKSEVGPLEDGIPISVNSNGDAILSPQINKTTAQTTISARSGQTVVFSGLITRNRSIATRGIPFVSDLPVIGQLFRFDVDSESRTELLIIMTPYIIETDEDMEMIKQIESQRMSWCLSDVIEMHGEVGLLGGCEDYSYEGSNVIYPDLNPTGEDLSSANRNRLQPIQNPPALRQAEKDKKDRSVLKKLQTARMPWSSKQESSRKSKLGGENKKNGLSFAKNIFKNPFAKKVSPPQPRTSNISPASYQTRIEYSPPPGNNRSAPYTPNNTLQELPPLQ